MNIIETARALLGLLPATIEAVKAIEAAIPEGGKGKEKLELVKITIQNAYTIGGATVDTFAAIWPAIENMVKGVVDLMNKIGKFSKTSWELK